MKAVGLMMSAKSMPMLAMKGAWTFFSLKTTVYSSVASMESTVFVHPHRNPVLRGAFLLGEIPALAEEFDVAVLHHPADREDDRIRVEGRPVVKLHPLARA